MTFPTYHCPDLSQKSARCVLVVAVGLVAMITGCKDVDDYIDDLASKDYGKRRSAARALGELGDARAVDPLIDALGFHSGISDAAADALVAIGRASVDALIAQLDDDSEASYLVGPVLARIGPEGLGPPQQVAYYVVTAKVDDAVALGSVATEPLIEALAYSDDAFRSTAVTALEQIGDARAAGPLAALLRDRNSSVPVAAVHDALVKIGPPAVEPLLAALRNPERSPYGPASYDRRIIETLVRIGDTRAVEPLMALVRDRHYQLGLGAVMALGQLGDARAVPILIDALGGWSLGASAQDALVSIGPPAANALIAALESEDNSMRERAAKALAQIGQPVVGLLIDSLKDAEHLALRDQLRSVLGRIGVEHVGPEQRAAYYIYAAPHDARGRLGKTAVPLLIDALGDHELCVRKVAARALGALRETRAVEPLISILTGGDTLDQMYAAKALAEIGDVRAIKSLLNTLTADRFLASDAAAEALVRIGLDKLQPDQRVLYYVHTCQPSEVDDLDQLPVDGVFHALRASNWDVRQSAAEVLEMYGIDRLSPAQKAIYYVHTGKVFQAARLGQEAVDPLVAMLAEDEFSIAGTRVAKVLGLIGDPRAVDPLLAVIKGEYGYRLNVVEALGKLGDRRAVPALIAALTQEYDDVREAAASGLGALGDARAVDPLLAATREHWDQSLRRSVVDAMAEIGIGDLRPDQRAAYYTYAGDVARAIGLGRAAVEPLIAILADWDATSRATATEALGRIADPRAVAPLIERLSDKSLGVRRVACEALSWMGEPAVEALSENLVTDRENTDWVRIALAVCAHRESAAVVITRLQAGSYPAEIRCLLMGWLGSASVPGWRKHDASDIRSSLSAVARQQELSEQEWHQVMSETSFDPPRIGVTLAALSIAPAHPGRQEQVEQLCLAYIRRGDVRIIPELTKLLGLYGTARMAEDYLNCGQADLDAAARRWAEEHGYSVGTGRGRIRARWGE